MLHVEGLHARLGRFSLHVETLDIPAGCYFLLLGPSGSGKTALLESLAGLNALEAGAITIDGRDATNLPPEARGIGFVYQRGWLFPHLSVRANVAFGLTCRGRLTAADRQRLDELATVMGIAGLLDRLPAKLSGGEAQRVALARALATQPRLLFLDEPLGPLDPAARHALAGELAAWHQRFGTTTVHVTHDHNEARELADRVGVIRAGRLWQSGSVAEVFTRPADSWSARFVGCDNLWPATVTDIADGQLGLRLGPRQFRLPSPPALVAGVGSTVTLALRPEELTLTDPVADAPAGTIPTTVTVAGAITAIADRGTTRHITVALAGTSLTAAALVTPAEYRRHGSPVTGAAVGLSFEAAAAHILPEGPGG